MEGSQALTLVVLFTVLIIGIGGWEAWTLFKTKDPEDHFTATMRSFAKKPLGTLVLMWSSWVVGVIMGHIWHDW
jgi:hypothetical protein